MGTAAGRPKAFTIPHKNTLFNQTSAMARQRRRPTSKMAPAKSSRGAPAKLQQRRDDTEVKKHAEFMARQVKIAVKRYPSLFQQHDSNLQTGIAALFHCAERTSRQRGERRAQDKLDSIIPPPKNSRSQRCLEVIVNGRLAATAGEKARYFVRSSSFH